MAQELGGSPAVRLDIAGAFFSQAVMAMVAGAVALVLALGMSVPQGADDPPAIAGGPRLEAMRVGVSSAAMDALPMPDEDTVRVRHRAVRLSDAYYTRLKLHRYSSYLMLPVSAYMYASGQQLMLHGRNAPSWAVNGHGIGAGVVAGLFTLNTYTGAMNWWETRNQEQGLKWRTAHAALMLMSDAGFFVVGQLATPAQTSVSTRRLHKNLAIASISMATVSYVMMLKPFRRD